MREASRVRDAEDAANTREATKRTGDMIDVYTLFRGGMPKHSTVGDYYLPTRSM